MFSTDHFFGAFDEYPTDIRHDAEKGEWVASALGLEARAKYQETALDELNHKIYDAVSRGELVPDMGN